VSNEASEVKKILVVDDSALMRRVLCDIINSDKRFQVVAKAKDGVEAFDLLSRETYDAVVLDVNMPRMTGLELLEELRKYKIPAKVMMASTDTMDGTETTLKALELGALDFIHKPYNVALCREDRFVEKILDILYTVACSKAIVFQTTPDLKQKKNDEKLLQIVKKHSVSDGKKKVVAIASSTGGPRALQSVIPKLPSNLAAPVLLVQHMPKGFTASLASRLNELSEIAVSEAAEGDVLEKGHVYVAQGGKHMTVTENAKGELQIKYTDEPAREGVKPCANYMYESLAKCSFGTVCSVVMTGMGCDGTEGIRNLKKDKTVYTISQSEDSCVVYGMPKSIVNSGLSDQAVNLEQIAQEIIIQVGTC